MPTSDTTRPCACQSCEALRAWGKARKRMGSQFFDRETWIRVEQHRASVAAVLADSLAATDDTTSGDTTSGDGRGEG